MNVYKPKKIKAVRGRSQEKANKKLNYTQKDNFYNNSNLNNNENNKIN